MLNVILKGLEKYNIEEYIVIENEKETVELYLREEELDMGRRTKVKSYEIKLFRNFTEGEENFKGDSTIVVYPRMSEDDVYRLIFKGYNNATKVKNNKYTVTDAIKKENIETETKLSKLTLEDAANKVKDTIYLVNDFEKGAINSVEVFVNRSTKRIITSEGTEVAYESYDTNGEFVTKWIEEKQRELTHKFRFNDLNENDIITFVKEAILNSAYIDESDESTDVNVDGAVTLLDIVENTKTEKVYGVI